MQVAFQAIEALKRNLVSDLGVHGSRVVTLQTGGVHEVVSKDFAGREEIAADIAASDRDGIITGPAINITGGAVVD